MQKPSVDGAQEELNTSPETESRFGTGDWGLHMEFMRRVMGQAHPVILPIQVTLTAEEWSEIHEIYVARARDYDLDSTKLDQVVSELLAGAVAAITERKLAAMQAAK